MKETASAIAEKQEGLNEIPSLAFETTDNTRALDKKFKPSDIAVGEYFIPNALGHSESEDIAARIIRASQKEGKFVAPSYKSLGEQLIAQLKMEDKISKQRQAKSAEQQSRGLVETFRKGVMKFLGREVHQEIPQNEPKQEINLPYSVLAFQCRFNPQSLPVEVQKMMNEGYINLVEKGDQQYLEPTEKLITQILQVQKARQEHSAQ